MIAGILAGGTGSRMGSEIPKQFLEIGGVPVLVRTVRMFAERQDVERVFLVMNREWMDYARTLLAAYSFPVAPILVEGGDTRFASMECLIRAALDCPHTKETVLIVHDCARPFVPGTVIDRLLDAMKTADMATASMPAVDSILRSRDGVYSAEMLTRSEIFCDQGPQCFRLDEMKNLLAALTAKERDTFMEAGAVYLAAEKKVAVVRGDRLSFKLTTPDDVEYAQYLYQKGVIK
ncbi:MAG: IspD/TarI family cytidylyltransferase [Clostridia bacterium]|nr:IspD/TarI family cytidylyltransferase [Clostridia bacterium]MDY6184294.1 IspD/TarI family cytidylyltransferase [Eubacteriales bacterium]